MIMRANPESDSDRDVFTLFPPDEGRTATLGILLPPSIAAAIRRTGNRKTSVSDQLLHLIDAEKLRELLTEDAEHQRKCSR